MPKRPSLSRWDAAVAAYLANRHAYGRACHKEEYDLDRLCTYLAHAGAAGLDQPLFDQWRAQFYQHSSSTRVVYEHTVYKCCRHRLRSEPDCFLPDREALARPRPHPLPTLIEPHQVAQLLAYVSGLCPKLCWSMWPAALRLVFVLLYTAGLCRGEVVRLTLGGVDAIAGVLHIRDSKFHKSRWVPLSPSARDELQVYLKARRSAGLDEQPSTPLFCTAGTRAYTGTGLYSGLKRTMGAAGICDDTGRSPRIQDFRHSFAVAALLRWYETDADVQSNLPKLALYMGHVLIVSTAYYLCAGCPPSWRARGNASHALMPICSRGVHHEAGHAHRSRPRPRAVLRGFPVIAAGTESAHGAQLSRCPPVAAAVCFQGCEAVGRATGDCRSHG